MSPRALVLALAAAACLAIASVVHQDAARAVLHHGGAIKLFIRLLRTPKWLLGRTVDTGALILQAFALAHGSLIAVQAALTTSVVIALLLEILAGRRVHVRELIGAGAVVIGATVLLAVGRPSDDGHRASLVVWAMVFAVAGVVVFVSSRKAHDVHHATRTASVLAVATGVCFALDAASLKALGEGGHAGRVVLFAAAFVVAALSGNILVQRAFQLAPLNASLPVLTATTPVAGVVVGAVLFHERFRSGLATRSVAFGAVVVLAGGALLAARPRRDVADVRAP